MLVALRRAENALFPAVEAVVTRVDASLVTEAVSIGSEGSIAASITVGDAARKILTRNRYGGFNQGRNNLYPRG